MDTLTKRPSYRGDRGGQKEIHYVVENIYNHEIRTFRTMKEIVEELKIPTQSINRKIRGNKGISYPHLNIEYLRKNGKEVNRDKWKFQEDGSLKKMEV